MKNKLVKIVLGGSPCTFWSIAQTRHRESKPEGMGWELFRCYVDAVRKINPDVFLYENNVSASRDVKDAIRSELGVWEGAIIGGEDTGVRYIEIDSALVSAQMRKRLYVVKGCGEPVQPKDRGIVIADILETGEAINCATGEKSYCLKGQYHKNGMANFLRGGGHYPGTGVVEHMRERERENSGLSELEVRGVRGKDVRSRRTAFVPEPGVFRDREDAGDDNGIPP